MNFTCQETIWHPTLLLEGIVVTLDTVSSKLLLTFCFKHSFSLQPIKAYSYIVNVPVEFPRS